MSELRWRARPTESHEYFRNPHKGCATFQHFEGDPLFEGTSWSEEGPTTFPQREHPSVTPGYLPSPVAYCRWFWTVFQPAKNRFDWTVIDRALETARQRGQTLQVRLMPYGSSRQPQVPEWYADVAPLKTETIKGRSQAVPDHSGDDFYQWWGNVVREFAARYDGHPDLESFDLAHIGPWGEGAAECSDRAKKRMAELYVSAFRKTPVLAMVAQIQYGTDLGTGWRCDCFGDFRERGNDITPHRLAWNHTMDAYPRLVCEGDAQEAWKNGPVVFETCGVPMGWHLQKQLIYDLDFNLRQGLKYHGSVFMPKSTALPEPWTQPLLDFCKRLGYRFVLRQLEYPLTVRRGQRFEYTMWIENVGVAPLYHDRYRVALSITQNEHRHVFPIDRDMTSWLPGDVWLREVVELPSSFKPGTAMLHAAIVNTRTNSPGIRFAVAEQDEAGWVSLDKIHIE